MKKKIILGAAVIVCISCLFCDQKAQWIKKTGQKAYQIYQNAQNLPPEKMAWNRGNRNVATVFFLNQKDSSLLSGTSGYGPWLETPWGNMRLVSCLSGIKGMQQSFVALEMRVNKTHDITGMKAQIAGNVPLNYKVMYPFDFYGKKRIFVLFELSHPFLTEPLLLNVRANITFCAGLTCQQRPFQADLTLPAHESYMTPICAKLMFDDMQFVRYGSMLFHHQFLTTATGAEIVKINLPDIPYPYVHFYPNHDSVKAKVIKVEKQAVWISLTPQSDFSGVLQVNHRYYHINWPYQKNSEITDVLVPMSQHDNEIIFYYAPWYIGGYFKSLALKAYPFFRHLINQGKIKITRQFGSEQGILLAGQILCPLDMPLKQLKRYMQDIWTRDESFLL